MASRQAAQDEPKRASEALLGENLVGVARAAGLEAAGRPQKGGQGPAVEAEEAPQQQRQPATHAPTGLEAFREGAGPRRDQTVASSERAVSRDAVAACGLATTTTSQSTATVDSRRQHSLIHRLIRFRVTAQPTLRLTVIPNRARGTSGAAPTGDGLRFKTNTRKWGVTKRRPLPCISRKSGRRRIRRPGGKPSRFDMTRVKLLTRNADRQLLATLATPATQNFAPAAGLHPLTESMGALAALAARLIGPLHGLLQNETPRGQGASRKGQRINTSFRLLSTRRRRCFSSFTFHRD